MAAPKATNDIWPRVNWPAHPVSMTTETVMMTKITTAVALSWFPAFPESSHGNASTAAPMTSPPTQRTARTSMSERSSRGTGPDLLGHDPGRHGVDPDP